MLQEMITCEKSIYRKTNRNILKVVLDGDEIFIKNEVWAETTEIRHF